MKKLVTLMMLVAMVSLVASSVQAATINVNPTDDTWVVQETPGHHPGTDADIRVGWDKRSNMEILRGLLKFDLSGVPIGQTIDEVKLHMYFYMRAGGSNVAMDAHKVTGNLTTWSEGTASWANTHQPPDGTTPLWTYTDVSDTVTIPGSGAVAGYKTWTIDKSYLSPQDVVTFAVRGPESGTDAADKYVKFYSSNAASNKPYLEVTYTPEPATMVLLGLGGIGVLLKRRRRA